MRQSRKKLHERRGPPPRPIGPPRPPQAAFTGRYLRREFRGASAQALRQIPALPSAFNY